jgi:hypothetical protein
VGRKGQIKKGRKEKRKKERKIKPSNEENPHELDRQYKYNVTFTHLRVTLCNGKQ